ncbi:MAG TPA: immunoglobulin domain-containing protein [Candidatus Hydrogenedentes bacterium]|nr:immunoglobulin domain-containing protein [Candidatus Hydrogenedentota bacterium]
MDLLGGRQISGSGGGGGGSGGGAAGGSAGLAGNAGGQGEMNSSATPGTGGKGAGTYGGNGGTGAGGGNNGSSVSQGGGGGAGGVGGSGGTGGSGGQGGYGGAGGGAFVLAARGILKIEGTPTFDVSANAPTSGSSGSDGTNGTAATTGAAGGPGGAGPSIYISNGTIRDALGENASVMGKGGDGGSGGTGGNGGAGGKGGKGGDGGQGGYALPGMVKLQGSLIFIDAQATVKGDNINGATAPRRNAFFSRISNMSAQLLNDNLPSFNPISINKGTATNPPVLQGTNSFDNDTGHPFIGQLRNPQISLPYNVAATEGFLDTANGFWNQDDVLPQFPNIRRIELIRVSGIFNGYDQIYVRNNGPGIASDVRIRVGDLAAVPLPPEPGSTEPGSMSEGSIFTTTVPASVANVVLGGTLNVGTLASLTAYVNTNQSLTANASSSGTITYQWQQYNHITGIWENYTGPNSNQPTISFYVGCILPDKADRFRCVIEDETSQAIAGPATVTYANIPIDVVAEAESVNVRVGENLPAPFTVTASGGNSSAFPEGPSFTYQWQRLNPVTNEWDNLSSNPGHYVATNNQLNLVDAQLADSGSFRCVVSDAPWEGCTQSPSVTTDIFKVTVFENLSIRVQPQSLLTRIGYPFLAAVDTPIGLGSLDYEWEANTGPLPAGVWYTPTPAPPNAAKYLMTAGPDTAAYYRVTITDPLGASLTSEAGQLSLLPFAIKREPEDLYAYTTASDLQVEVQVEEARGTVEYQWFRVTPLKKALVEVPGATSNTLVFANETDGEEIYQCRVRDMQGATVLSELWTREAKVRTAKPFAIVEGLKDDLAVMPGTSKTLTVVTEGGLDVHFTWKKDGEPIADSADSPTYVVDSVDEADVGRYSVEATYRGGSVSSSANIQLYTPQVPMPAASRWALGLLAALISGVALRRIVRGKRVGIVVLLLVLAGLGVSWAPAHAQTTAPDFDKLLLDFKAVLSSLFTNLEGVDTWSGGSSPIYQRVQGQPIFTGYDLTLAIHGGNGIRSDDYFSMVETLVNTDASCTPPLNSVNPNIIPNIKSAYGVSFNQIRNVELTIENLYVHITRAVVSGITLTNVNVVIPAVTTGQVNTLLGFPVDIPSLWSNKFPEGEDGLFRSAVDIHDPQLYDINGAPVEYDIEDCMQHLGAACMTTGDEPLINWYRGLFGNLCLGVVQNLIPKLLEGLGKKSLEKGLTPEELMEQIAQSNAMAAAQMAEAKALYQMTGCTNQHIVVFIDQPDTYVDGYVDIYGTDLCNALNNAINNFSCVAYPCQSARLASLGDLNMDGTTNRASYVTAGGNRAAWFTLEAADFPEIVVQSWPAQPSSPVFLGTITWVVDVDHTIAGAANYRFSLFKRSNPGDPWVEIDTSAGTYNTGNGQFTFNLDVDWLQHRYFKWQVETGCGTGMKESPVYDVNVPAPPINFTPGLPEDRCVRRNDPFSFTIEASSSTGTLSYQWQRNNGAGWADISGATGLTYSKASANNTTDIGQYRCKVTNTLTYPGGSASYFEYSPTASLHVLYYYSQPKQYISVILGGTIDLQVRPAGGNVPNPVPFVVPDPQYFAQYTYQWYKDNNPISGSANPSATTQRLTITNAQLGTEPGDSGEYHCVISDGCVAQGHPYTPKTTVTVTNTPIVIANEDQPVGGGRVIGGLPKVFTVKASGGEPGQPLVCEWFHADDAAGNGAVSLGPPADMLPVGDGVFFKSELTVDINSTANAGYYFAVLTDGSQILSSSLAPLFVGYPLTVVTAPQGGIFHAADTHDPPLSVVVSGGVGEVTYEWYRDGLLLPVSSPTYNLTPLAPYDAGVYTVRVRDTGVGDGQPYQLTPTYAGSPDGVYESAPVQIQVLPIPLLTPNGQPQHQTGPVGGNYTFTVSVEGEASAFTYKWFRKMSSGSDVEVGNEQSFTIVNAQLADQGQYYCVITDPLGQAKGLGAATLTSAPARLTLVGPSPEPLQIVRQPSSVTVNEGAPFGLSVLVTGGPTLAYTYAWAKDGQLLAGETNPALVRAAATVDDEGVYRVTVDSGIESQVSEAAQVTVVLPQEKAGAELPVAAGAGLGMLIGAVAVAAASRLRKRR